MGQDGRVGPVKRLLMRSPIQLYRFGLGWVLGGRFLLLEHLGRRSGEWRRTVLEVVETIDGVPTIVSGFGDRSQWCRNLEADGAVFYTSGRTRRPATAVRLTPDQARPVFDRYRRDHPRAARVLGGTIGVSLVDDVDGAAERLPVFRLESR